MNLPSGLRLLFWPASVVLEGGAVIRAALYRRGVLRQQRLNGVVLSVGNLTVGGTGKTPMVLWLAERLLAEGKRVGILTRGYKGVFAAEAGRGSASDEVALLQRRLRRRALFGIGANRYAKGSMLERHGVGWFVLDDGFQHLRLARDVDIVLIDATDPFGGGYLIPAGRLREPRSALGRADIVVITRAEHSPAVETLVRRQTDVPIFYALTSLDGVFTAGLETPGAAGSEGEARVAGDARGKRLFAFCGIANPRAFLDDLRRWDLELAGEAVFPDHHRFSAADLAVVAARARAAHADALICTEKDLYNFPSQGIPAIPLFFARISLRVSEAERFWQTILSIVERRGRGSAQ